MNTKLITALRTAAKAIESRTFFYSWKHFSTCNCGSLFCALSGVSASELAQKVPKSINGELTTWAGLVGQYCPITGIPTHELFKKLMSHGLTQTDIINLEYLSDSRVLSKMPHFFVDGFWGKKRQYINYKNPYHVVAYMRAWADILVAEGSTKPTDEYAVSTESTSLVSETKDKI